MKYINSFANENAIQTALDNETLLKPYVAYNQATSGLSYNALDKTDYSKKYFTLKALESGIFRWNTENSVEYSLNDGAWTTWTYTGYSGGISVSEGDEIRFRSVSNNYSYETIVATGNFEVYGNIMSLLYGDNFENQTSAKARRSFYRLFSENPKLIYANNLILPINTWVGDEDYGYMFYKCINLVSAPVLPATTLGVSCYFGMFSNCYSLTTTPELPATTPANSCYSGMFSGCSGLTTAPEIKFTSIPNESACYQMFHSCTNLNYVKCLSTKPTGYNATTAWLYNVSATGTFVKKSGVNWDSGTSGIPEGWTVIEE